MAGPRPGQRPEDGYRILCPCSFPSPQITRSTSAHVPARSSSQRERGLGRVGNRQPGKAKLPLGAARFVSSACVVWCGLGAWAGGRTDVLIAFCIVGRAKSATHARSPGGCLSVCLRACESLGLRRSGRGRARAASLQHDAVRLGPRGTGQRI